MSAEEFARSLGAVLELGRTHPREAAARLDDLADALKECAANLRRQAEGGQSRGGTDDRVQMRVVGPGGEVKQETDTGIGT